MPALDPGERGAGDISIIAAYTAWLDGLGIRGCDDHAPGEWANLAADLDQTSCGVDLSTHALRHWRVRGQPNLEALSKRYRGSRVLATDVLEMDETAATDRERVTTQTSNSAQSFLLEMHQAGVP